MQWLSPKALEESERGGASTRDMECALTFASKMKIFHAVGYRCLVYTRGPLSIGLGLCDVHYAMKFHHGDLELSKGAKTTVWEACIFAGRAIRALWALRPFSAKSTCGWTKGTKTQAERYRLAPANCFADLICQIRCFGRHARCAALCTVAHWLQGCTYGRILR
jgi:hypothetical protein